MKYFTYDLLTLMNNESLKREIINSAEQVWINNAEEYSKIYSQLIEILPIDVFTRFSKVGFHDYKLEELNIQHQSLFHTNIELILKDERDHWKLLFKDISSFSFKHLNKNIQAPIFEPTIDTWVKEEFLPIDHNTLSFEVLFSSGANLQITFDKQNINLAIL